MNGDSGLLNELIGEARLVHRGIEYVDGMRADDPGTAKELERVMYRGFFTRAVKLLRAEDAVRRQVAPERYAEENRL